MWCAVLLPAIFIGGIEIFDDLDERLFHLPTIQAFASELPWPSLSDYQSATTPLYHLVLSPVAAVSDSNISALRLVNLLISGCTLAIVGAALARWGSDRSALLGMLLVGASPYFVGPAIRLSTDNAALLSVFLVLMLTHPNGSRRAGLAAMFATAAVLTRQLHLWLMVPLLYAAWSSERNLKQWIAWSALPVLALIPFVVTWGALTPPQFADGHQRGINANALVMFLGVLGAHSVCAAPWMIRTLRSKSVRLWVPGVVALCWAFLSHHSMPWVDDPNRIGGALWTLSKGVPEILGVPLTFWLTVPLGALMLLALVGHPIRNHGRFIAICAIAFVIANLMSGRAYQKYYDPMSLFFAAALIQGQPEFEHTWLNRAAWALPVLWVIALAGMSTIRIYG